MFAEYDSYDGCGLAELVRKGEVKAEELFEEALDRAQRHSDLNAIVHFLEDYGRRALADGLPDGPFRGVPFLLKDVQALAGTPMSLGSVLLRNNAPKNTHVVVQKMMDTGVVLFGRTNMSELGLLPTAENDLLGATHNPWNREHSTGGSSGGTGAAIAAGIVPMAHGGDGGGSIRIPASACGVFGLKPGRGRNPAEPYDEPNEVIQYGVLSRSVRDTAVMLDATRGRSSANRFIAPAPERAYGEMVGKDPREPLRIAFSTKDFRGRLADPECRRAVEKTAKLCEELGHKVEEGEPAIDGVAFNAAFRKVWTGFAGHFFRQIGAMAKESGKIPELLHPVVDSGRVVRTLTGIPLGRDLRSSVMLLTRRMGRLDEEHSPGVMWNAWTVLRTAEVAMSEFLTGSYDLFLTPVLGTPPWKLGTVDEGASIDSLEALLMDYAGFTPLANTGGFPAMSVPLHVDGGMPIGSHFTAAHGGEGRLLQLAAQLERAAPWPHRAPGF